MSNDNTLVTRYFRIVTVNDKEVKRTEYFPNTSRRDLRRDSRGRFAANPVGRASSPRRAASSEWTRLLVLVKPLSR